MISKAALERTFGPLTDIDASNPAYHDMWNGAPQDAKPCETGLISEITECNHCKFNCKVEENEK